MGNRLKLFVASILLLCCGFCFGVIYQQSKDYSGTITPKQAIIQLENCQQAHQYYVDNPSKCNVYTGDVEQNQDWVREYSEIIELVKRFEHSLSR